ncbi:hypothetical protein HGRIS_000122 [Hohenbuehelia grisea]|uniref:E3 ubiquitin-protein ligase listerin n=1 Tax=Hohenbuehelia grisea TaxID=104357 RepID=A0ABR3JS83_9AGAR
MVKGNSKSSASSGTRKKHARKATGPDGDDDSKSGQQSRSAQPTKGKDGKKLSKAALKAAKEARPKVYIPPQRPVNANPDPLDTDTTGLVHRLPPDLVVVLRSLGKKAAVTRVRALEELQEKWVNEENIVAVIDMLPVWLHHAPGFFVHANRRLRQLSASLHASLLRMPDVRNEICAALRNSALSGRALGPSCLLAHDVDRVVASAAFSSWTALVNQLSISTQNESSEDDIPTPFTHIVNLLVEFCTRVLIEPLSVYTELTPSHVPTFSGDGQSSGRSSVTGSRAPTPAHAKKGKDAAKGAAASVKGKQKAVTPVIASKTLQRPDLNVSAPDADVDFETDGDRAARLRVATLGSIRWLVNECTSRAVAFPPSLANLLSTPMLWSALCAASRSPFPTGAASHSEEESSSDEDGDGDGDHGSERAGRVSAQDAESLGYGQPIVRRAAWGLAAALIVWAGDRHQATTTEDTSSQDILPLLSKVVLRCAWIESDPLVFAGGVISGVLGVLKAIPRVWEFEVGAEAPHFSLGSSPAYQSFLHFLSEGCAPASPEQAYPAVVLVLASLPSGIYCVHNEEALAADHVGDDEQTKFIPLPDVITLFEAFWTSLGSRALTGVLHVQRALAHAAFLAAFVECLALIARRTERDPTNDHGDANRNLEAVVTTQFPKTLHELASGRLIVPPATAGAELARGIKMLHNVGKLDGAGDGDLSSVALDSLSQAMRALTVDRIGKTVQPDDAAHDEVGAWTLVLGILNAFAVAFSGEGSPKPDAGAPPRSNVAAAAKTDKILDEVLQGCVFACEGGLTMNSGDLNAEVVVKDAIASAVHPLAMALEIFGSRIFGDDSLAKRVDDVIETRLETLVLVSPAPLLAYLQKRDEQRAIGLWRQLLQCIAKQINSADGRSERIRGILSFWLDATRTGKLPPHLKLQATELDQSALSAVDACLSDGGADAPTEQRRIVIQIVQARDFFLSPNGFVSLLDRVGTFLKSEVDLALRSQEPITSTKFDFPLQVLQAVSTGDAESVKPFASKLAQESLPSVFLLGSLLPKCTSRDDDVEPQLNNAQAQIARSIILFWIPVMGEELQKEVELGLKTHLRELLVDTEARPRPQDILSVVLDDLQGLRMDFLADFLPSQQQLLSELNAAIPRNVISPALAVIDPLVPPDDSATRILPQSALATRYRSYTRVFEALISYFDRDPDAVGGNAWIARHLFEIMIYEEDRRNMGLISSTNLASAPKSIIESMLPKVVISLRKSVLQAAEKGSYDAAFADSTQSVHRMVAEVLKDTVASDVTRDVRVLHRLLVYVFHGLEKDEGEQWVGFARKVEKTAPESSMAIILAITQSEVEPTRLDRYRNELAASLSGIPARKANKDGLLMLRKLAVAAPHPESDLVFLPQQRAVQLVKACQQWVLADGDDDDDEGGLSEAVESAMTLTFLHVAPILQNIPGSHWDMIYDVIESNLEACDLQDQTTLTTMARTLRLVQSIEDLSSTNKALRSHWVERRSPVLTALKAYAQTKIDPENRAVPTSLCLELVLALLEDAPSSFFDEMTLPQTCHLLQHPSIRSQKMSYNLLQAAAKKRTEHFVLEAGVNVDDDFTADLPMELIELVSCHVEIGQDEPVIFGNLLAWMVLFDLFQDSSQRVKASYVSQLRTMGIISDYLLPNVFHLLSLDEGPNQAFKLDPWAVDEFYVSHYETGTDFAPQAFAAHLFYRALSIIPSLVHSWILDCKDRRLSAAVTTYTSQHFSPVLIRSELIRVKEPDVATDLADENFTIKVAINANEITVLYNVDEHQLEIRLKIPQDWPLHRIEVKDVQRYGVDDRRWRAWILGVQQTVWSQNGRIIDALGLFKKNVSLHFSGQTECAICYSIISVVDGALPRKPCNTCKNRFHASCLFKPYIKLSTVSL